MTFSYGLRLACLCLEMIFLVNLLVSLIVAACTAPAARAARTMRSHSAARLFFTLRLLPFALSLLVVASLCIPSYLRYERNIGVERVGWFCLIASTFGLALCAASAFSSLRAFAQSCAVELQIQRLQVRPSAVSGTPMYVAGKHRSCAPLLALTGILRPRLIISQRLLDALSPDQIETAISHERAHQSSRDNLKRLIFAVTPAALPFVSALPCGAAFRTVERHWERYAELAADEAATGGRIDRCVALAEALLQVARLHSYDQRIPLASALAAHELELVLRVDRLMAAGSCLPLQRPRTTSPPPHSTRNVRLSSVRALVANPMVLRISALLLAFAALTALLPGLLHPLYHLLESLLH